MKITSEPPLINPNRKVSNTEEAEDAIMHLIFRAWVRRQNRIDVTIILENGVKNTFTHHQGDSFIDFAKKLLDEAKKHL